MHRASHQASSINKIKFFDCSILKKRNFFLLPRDNLKRDNEERLKENRKKKIFKEHFKRNKTQRRVKHQVKHNSRRSSLLIVLKNMPVCVVLENALSLRA